jgi:uncharacterized protein (TIGR03067 family)
MLSTLNPILMLHRLPLPLRRLTGVLFALITSAGCLFAADSPDAKALRGDWLPVKAELGGRAMPEAVLKAISLKLGDGTYDVLADGHPDKGTYRVDPSAKPKTMVIRGTEGPNQGKTIPAIYELQGDTLRICYDLSGAKTPSDFKSPAGTRLYLVTYQRKK